MQKILNTKYLKETIMATITYVMLCCKVLPAYNTYSWILYLLLVVVFNKMNFKDNKYKNACITFSIIFSLILIFGDIAYKYQEDNLTSYFSVLFTFKTLVCMIGTFNLMLLTLTWTIPKLIDVKIPKSTYIPKIKTKRKIFIISFLIIFIGYIPYFLSFYPGILSPDSITELKIIIDNFSNISAHHTILHILFISIPVNIGNTLFNSLEIGIALSSITQMICLSLTFAHLITFLYQRKANKLAIIIITVFYAINPVFGYYSITMWKDVMFAATFLLLTIELIKIYEKNSNNKLTTNNISFIIISLICVFFRNNAIYMYILLTIATIIIFKKQIKKILPSILIVFAVYLIINGPVFNALNISKSKSAEYIAIPLQQIGRMAYKNVSFTQEETNLLNKLIPVSVMKEVYNPKTVDTIKFNQNYNGTEFDTNKTAYIKLWLNLIIKHPDIAIEAYTTSTLGYYYPGVSYWSVSKEIVENDYNITMKSKSNLMYKALSYIENKDIPIINIIWSIGTCFWIITIFGYVTIKRKNLKAIYPFIAVFGIWITLMIASPVYAEFRYIFCAYTTLPLLIAFPYLNNKTD